MNQKASQGAPLPSRSSDGPRAARMSGLAIAALVLAAVPCCPAISLAGIILGMAAMRRIQTANGKLGGRRLAQWAVGVGAAITILSTLSYTLLVRHFDQSNRAIITAQVAEVINAAAAGQVDRAAKAWNQPPGRTPSQSDFESFGSQIKDRYGGLKRFSISSMMTGGSLFQQQIEIAGVYIFQNAERPGAAVFDVQTKANDLWPSFRLRQIVIEDRERGDLKLPADLNSP